AVAGGHVQQILQRLDQLDEEVQPVADQPVDRVHGEADDFAGARGGEVGALGDQQSSSGLDVLRACARVRRAVAGPEDRDLLAGVAEVEERGVLLVGLELRGRFRGETRALHPRRVLADTTGHDGSLPWMPSTSALCSPNMMTWSCSVDS